MNEKPGWFHISKTSGNKRLARSMLLILCAAISLIFTGAFITYAVLKTVTPTATNVFQSDKNIRIKLDEHSGRIMACQRHLDMCLAED